MQIGLPITGKYRDPESDQYYNNNNVRKKSDCSRGTFSFLHYSRVYQFREKHNDNNDNNNYINDNYISFILCGINIHS